MPQIWAESQKNSKNLYNQETGFGHRDNMVGNQTQNLELDQWNIFCRQTTHFHETHVFLFFFFFFLLSQFSNLLSPASTIIAIFNQNGPSKYVHKSIVTKCM